ncbi:hypothetical protein EBS02_11095, partial [bacterium]|nr:hypothetical protein [bacterium]
KGNKNTHYSHNWRNGLHFYSPLEIFEEILIINLPSREDRRLETEKELGKFCLSTNKYHFVEAFYDKENGAKGCTKSHIQCLEYALKHNLENIIILEDDFDFPKSVVEFNKKILTFLLYDLDYDVLLLNFSEHGPPINLRTSIDGLYRNLWSSSAAGYILRKNIIRSLLDVYKKSLELGPHDFYWNHLRLDYNWFVMKGVLGYQRPSYSDIEKRKVEYDVSHYEKI